VNAATVYARLLAAKVPVLGTAEAAAVLGLSPVAASQALRRLAAAGLVRPLRHGLTWVSQAPIDPWVVLEHLSAPYPAYGSLYSALYLRGVLSQVPQMHFAVTLGRTQRIRTRVGTYSLHQVVPELFGGFESLASGAKLATVEKALFDLAYLSATRSRLFSRPPELELPRRLERATLSRWADRITAARRQVQVRARLKQLLGKPAGRAT
jgi:predicted transcriptional regulator of viral defense system